MAMSNHPFHLVTLSPWPYLMSLSVFNFLFSSLNFFFCIGSNFIIFFCLISLIFVFLQWVRDIIRESMFQGLHTYFVYKFLKFSVILFIITELFFFISFFWSFFHNSVSPSVDIGNIWPPLLISFFDPYDIPLMNSVILISSGLTASWSHNGLLIGNYNNLINGLILTIFLGFYFSFIQYIEYFDSLFCMNDGIFGSLFYMLTGFHGIHVLIGTLLLISSFLRAKFMHFSSIHHFNFEFSLWYWHFVDVVWLFLYIFVYWFFN
uniref:Cytochrome c oxidase subunit 3 n=1 Tax=Habropoda radoszkowskii TaxID=597470 RepID=A0A7L8EYF5_9HYME|nr:cytochrome c oxidase subunit III [Habropoda radoszkowskii]QOE17518.1 cytochrome c oxidase subunit 3 [Habropoda radoszkowskii]